METEANGHSLSPYYLPPWFLQHNRHSSVTDAQARRLLGFPDAIIVSTPFGIYIADNIQTIQLVLIANCRDDTSTRIGVQRVFNWLEQSGEDTLLSERAKARTQIIKTIAKVV